MAYSTIDKSTAHFNTKLYTGNGSTQSITGVGFQPDWVWLKNRTTASTNHFLNDAVRGAGKYLITDSTGNEGDSTGVLSSFDSDGFSLGNYSHTNGSGNDIVSWNWLAGGTTPSKTYTVKVVSDSGNKYRFDDFGTSAVTLDLQEGGTYTFDQSDSSNSGHPLRFSTTSNGSHGGGSEYTTGVTTNGTPGSSGAYTRITVASGAPTLYYYCTNHSGMGGQANTNSTHGSSNFSGSIQSTVSANTTAGFSIVKYTGTGANATVGHGLGSTPKVVIVKQRTTSNYNWVFGSDALTSWAYIVKLNLTDAEATGSGPQSCFNSTAPTSSVFSIGTSAAVSNNTDNFIAYCFSEKTGYSKFGTFTGNQNTDGTFIYTGFKPSWVMFKEIVGNSPDNWFIYDNKRSSFNQTQKYLRANLSNAEADGSAGAIDILSNGFKLRTADTGLNENGGTYIYMAFGQSIVGSNNIPATAR